jgi:hypothetical protein
LVFPSTAAVNVLSCKTPDTKTAKASWSSVNEILASRRVASSEYCLHCINQHSRKQILATRHSRLATPPKRKFQVCSV